MEPLNIKVIIGSTRQGRVSDKPARWIHDELAKRPEFAPELLDLRDFPLPPFNQAVTPSVKPEGYGPEAGPVYPQWRAKIAEADAYVIVTPEYNHGYPGELKNAIDWVWYEWNKKPVGFVAYGNAGGARAVEQLRQVAVELELASVRRAVHLPGDVYAAISKLEAPADPALFAPADKFKEQMFDQLAWWGRALRTARNA